MIWSGNLTKDMFYADLCKVKTRFFRIVKQSYHAQSFNCTTQILIIRISNVGHV